MEILNKSTKKKKKPKTKYQVKTALVSTEVIQGNDPDMSHNATDLYCGYGSWTTHISTNFSGHIPILYALPRIDY